MCINDLVCLFTFNLAQYGPSKRNAIPSVFWTQPGSGGNRVYTYPFTHCSLWIFIVHLMRSTLKTAGWTQSERPYTEQVLPFVRFPLIYSSWAQSFPSLCMLVRTQAIKIRQGVPIIPKKCLALPTLKKIYFFFFHSTFLYLKEKKKKPIVAIEGSKYKTKMFAELFAPWVFYKCTSMNNRSVIREYTGRYTIYPLNVHIFTMHFSLHY